MTQYQRTLVRYDKEGNTAFFGVLPNGKLGWYECSFDDLVHKHIVHKIYHLTSSTSYDEDDNSKEAIKCKKDVSYQIEYFKDLIIGLLSNNLMPKEGIYEGKKMKYMYVVKDYDFDTYIIWELLGIKEKYTDNLTLEESYDYREKMKPIWEKFDSLDNIKEDYIDLSNAF